MTEKKDNNIASVMESLMKGAEAVFTTKTVVGEATKIDDTIIIPLVDVSFGFGAGSSCGSNKDGGMGGMNGENVSQCGPFNKERPDQTVNIKNQDSVTKILDMIPDLVEKFTTKKEEMVSDEEAVDAAFPDEEKAE